MKLDAEQRQVVARIRAIARRRGVKPIELEAALQTGIVESGLRNLNHGDADSKGWRQERASLYKNPTNLDASINRFFDETGAVRGKYKRAGDLAAAVQRPAAQYRGRYAQVAGQARSLMGGPIAPPTVGSAAGRPQQADTTVDDAIVGAMLQGRKKGSLFQDVLRRVASAPPELAEAGAAPSIKDAPPTVGGDYAISPTANRKGVGLKPYVLDFAGRMAAITGGWTIGTGTNHNQMTTSGNVSDHWDGSGMDIPAKGKKGDAIAYAAFIAAGVPPKKAGLWSRNGGLYNITVGGLRIQVIWKTNQGGNHFDHVHVGIRPGK